jgi:hypothetical protein
VDDLAREAALGRNTILRAELAEDQTSLTVANNLAVRRALGRRALSLSMRIGAGPECGCGSDRRKKPEPSDRTNDQKAQYSTWTTHGGLMIRAAASLLKPPPRPDGRETSDGDPASNTAPPPSNA